MTTEPAEYDYDTPCSLCGATVRQTAALSAAGESGLMHHLQHAHLGWVDGRPTLKTLKLWRAEKAKGDQHGH